MYKIAFVFLLMLTALPGLAVAQESASPTLPEPFSGYVDIPAKEWRAEVLGRTVTYYQNGEFYANERYDPSGNGVEIQLFDGTCLRGTWEHTAPLYCFHWADSNQPDCFRHLRKDDQILITSSDLLRAANDYQIVATISDLLLTCGPMVLG